MDKKGLEKCKNNLDWLAENGGKLGFKELFTKIFDGTNATLEDMIHFGEVIKKGLIEAKETKEKLT